MPHQYGNLPGKWQEEKTANFRHILVEWPTGAHSHTCSLVHQIKVEQEAINL